MPAGRDLQTGVRERYSQLLTIGHFREAMRSKTHGAVELLDRAIRSADKMEQDADAR